MEITALSSSRTTVSRSERVASTVSSTLLGSGFLPISPSTMVSGLVPPAPLNSGSERRLSWSATASSASRDLMSSIWLDSRASMEMAELVVPEVCVAAWV